MYIAILILVLDLYFRLTPPTMVKETPEVQELARLTHITTDEVVEILDAFLHCDPYLNRRDISLSTIMVPCQNIWQRYGNGATEDLASLAALLKEYYKSDK